MAPDRPIDNKTAQTFSEKELTQTEHSEKSRRFIQNAIEVALSLGDFQKHIDEMCTSGTILTEVADRIEQIIHFDAVFHSENSGPPYV